MAIFLCLAISEPQKNTSKAAQFGRLPKGKIQTMSNCTEQLRGRWIQAASTHAAVTDSLTLPQTQSSERPPLAQKHCVHCEGDRGDHSFAAGVACHSQPPPAAAAEEGARTEGNRLEHGPDGGGWERCREPGPGKGAGARRRTSAPPGRAAQHGPSSGPRRG